MSRAWEDKRRRSAVPRGSLPRKLRVSGWWDLATFPSGLTRPLLDPAPWKFPRWFVCYMQLLKVRLTLHLGALSPGAGKDPPAPLSLLATLLRGPWPPGAARRKLYAALRAAPGTRPRCSRAMPPPATLPAADCSKASEERPRLRREGRCCYFLAPAPRAGEEGCGGAACSAPAPTSAPSTAVLVCGVKV